MLFMGINLDLSNKGKNTNADSVWE